MRCRMSNVNVYHSIGLLCLRFVFRTMFAVGWRKFGASLAQGWRNLRHRVGVGWWGDGWWVALFLECEI